MISEFIEGIFGYFKVFSAIRKYKLMRLLIFSGLLSITLYGVGVYGFWQLSDIAGDYLVRFYPFEFGAKIINKLSDIIAFTGCLALFTIIFKHIILVVTSPLMSIISEKIEKTEHPNVQFNQSVIQKGIGVIRGLRIALRSIRKELVYTLLLLILGWIIPFLMVVTTPLIFIIQAYYAGVGNADFYLERHLNVKESASFSKRHTFLVIGNGTIFLLLFFIPFLGAFFAPAFGTISSSLSIDKRIDH